MATHEFGIIREVISENDNFLSYEPERYGCIKIDDDYIENLMPAFLEIPTFFHRLSWHETGLNYIGITLIPPESCERFADIFQKQNSTAYSELILLFRKASAQEKFVIHYGL